MKRLPCFLIIILNSLVTLGCSYLRAPAIPTTPFLSHGSEMKAQPARAPWDAVWSSNPGHIAVQLPEVRKIYVAPVNTTYINSERDDKGNLLVAIKVEPSDIETIAELIRTSFIASIANTPATNLKVVDAPGPDVLSLEIALTQLKPTKTSVNGVADVGGLLLPGSKFVADAVAAGGQAAGGAYAAGSIAIEFKLVDGKSGRVLAEAKDHEDDAMSILPNYRDFEQYGWSKYTIGEWAKQFAEMFSTPITEKISSESDVSIAPW